MQKNSMLKSQTNEWSKAYLSAERAYPAEYVIRMLKGSFPRLNLRESGYKGKSILDIGCGDGRNFVLYNQLGFEKIGGGGDIR